VTSPTTPAPRSNRHLVPNQNQENLFLGATLMCGGMLAGSSIDIGVKALAGDYSTAQIVFLRGLIAIPIVLALVQQQTGVRALAQLSWRWQLWRGLLTAGANFGFFYGLIYVPLVTALMLAYVGPVLIVLFARPLLGERITLLRMAGVLISLAGVLYVIQPGSLEIHPAIFAILGSALCWALLSINNRQLATKVSAPVLTFYTYPVSFLIGGVLCFDSFIVPGSLDWLLFGMVALGSTVAHWLVALAYRQAQAGAIAPFEYTALIWLTLAGYFIWDEVPGVEVWLGGARSFAVAI
jgi:drug/metabolite transporter (DMT)-like permease